MEANKKEQDNAATNEQKGATEDPPTNNVKQNEPGKESSNEINVPKEALEHYKQSGNEGEE